MEKLVRNIGPCIQPGDNGTLAVYAGTPGSERDTGERIKARNVERYVFRSARFGIADVVRGENVCGTFHL